MPCSLNRACGDDGYDPRVFGPTFWTTMHLVAHSFPSKPTARDAKRYARFFDAIAFPDGVPTRRRVAKWLYRHHCKVTKRVSPNKPSPDFEAVEAHYARLRGA